MTDQGLWFSNVKDLVKIGKESLPNAGEVGKCVTFEK